MSGASGATIKIDGDAQGYVRAAERAAKSTKEVASGWGQVGQAMDQTVGRLGKVNLAVLAVSASVAAVTKGYESWVQRIEKAAEAAKKTAESVAGGMGHSKLLRDEAAKIASPLTMEQKGDVMNAYRSRRPQDSKQEILGALRSASDAAVAGFDPRRHAALQADLAGFGGSKADLATMLMEQGGDQAESMAGMLRDIGSKSSLQDAAQTLPMIHAAARIPGGMDALNQGWRAYLDQGRSGGFAKAFRASPVSLVPELGQRRTVAELAAADGDGMPAIPGLLESRRSAALMDPIQAGMTLNSVSENSRNIDSEKEKALEGIKRHAADEMGRILFDKNAGVRAAGYTAAGVAKVLSLGFADVDPSNARFMGTVSASLGLTELSEDKTYRETGRRYRQVNGLEDGELLDPSKPLLPSQRREQDRSATLLEEQNDLIRSQRRPVVPPGFAAQGD